MLDRELNHRYKKLFVEFNRKYFNGKLANYRVMIVGHITRGGELGVHLKKSLTIKVAAMEHDAIIATLLHEMAHASAGDAHKERFCKEMDRLAALGAPINKDEAQQYRENMHVKLNLRYFRTCADDAFADESHRISLQGFCQFMAREHGEWSTAAFVREHPAIKSAFRQARKAFLENRKLKKEFLARLAAKHPA